MIFLDGLVGILGATPTIAPYARQYAMYILIGTPFMASSLVLNNQLRFQGSAFFGMIGMGVGAVLNIALDPLFIFVLDMGVSGAALATIRRPDRQLLPAAARLHTRRQHRHFSQKLFAQLGAL